MHSDSRQGAAMGMSWRSVARLAGKLETSGAMAAGGKAVMLGAVPAKQLVSAPSQVTAP